MIRVYERGSGQLQRSETETSLEPLEADWGVPHGKGTSVLPALGSLSY